MCAWILQALGKTYKLCTSVCASVFFFLCLQDCDPHNCMSETIFNLNSLTTFHFGLWDQTIIWTLQGCYEQHNGDYPLSFALLKHACFWNTKLVFERGITNKVICIKEFIFANLN